MSDVIKLRPGYRKTREEENLLRQFTNTDGPKGATAAYKRGHERIFGKKTADNHGVNCTVEDICDDCGFCEICVGCHCE